MNPGHPAQTGPDETGRDGFAKGCALSLFTVNLANVYAKGECANQDDRGLTAAPTPVKGHVLP